MNSKQRLTAALRGEEVDRVPIWLRDRGAGIPLLFGGPAPADDFRKGYQADPLYHELYDYTAPHIDQMDEWDIPVLNRNCLVPPSSNRPLRTKCGSGFAMFCRTATVALFLEPVPGRSVRLHVGWWTT